MLKKTRVILAALFIAGITLLFSGAGHDWWGWMAKLQFLTATLRLIGGATLGNIAVVGGILLLTLLFGRIYCSVICPLGVFQDSIIWLRRKVSRKKGLKKLRKHFKFNKERRILRYGVAVVFIACIAVGLQPLVALLAPYSAYGRMVSAIFGGGPAPLLITAAATFLLITACAWLWGREWCGSVCPVGTVLSLFGRASLFRIKINEDRCVKCGSCSRACKASCIEEGSLRIDLSRCIDCFDCIGVCHTGAISFGTAVGCKGSGAGSKGKSASSFNAEARPDAVAGSKTSPAAPAYVQTKRASADAGRAEASRAAETVSSGRRAFLATSAIALAAGAKAAAQEMKLDGGLAPLEDKIAVERGAGLVPPGAGGVKDFYSKCTACQLCVQACPNQVLRPSTELGRLLQPVMGYENGFCRPECTACSDVCPAGAIKPLAEGEKTAIRIGTARVDTSLCLAATGKENCGQCEFQCPAGAIEMVRDASGVRLPVVAEEQCIGCGKCEYLCPVRPVSAITVRGLETHIEKLF